MANQPSPELDLDPLENDFDSVDSGLGRTQRRKEIASSNLKTLLTNPSTRPKVIATAIILVLALIIGFIQVKKGEERLTQQTVVAEPPSTNYSGSSANAAPISDAYEKLNKEQNEVLAKTAEETNSSHMDNILPGEVKPLNFPDISQEPQRNVTELDRDVNGMTLQTPVAYTPVDNSKNIADNAAQDAQITTAMANQINALMSGWSYKHHTNIDFNQKSGADVNNESSTSTGVASTPEKTNTSVAQVAQTSTSNSGNNKAYQGPVSTITAGKVYFGVSELSINTDSSSKEVIATVLEGPMSGATLIGTFTAGAESVSVKLTKAALPWHQEMIPINVLMVHSETKSRDLATSVDKHRLERLSAIFLGSVVSGIGTAAERSGSISTVGVNGETVSFGELDTAAQIKVGLGRGGQAIANDIMNETRVQTTIKVEAEEGEKYEVGLLFMENVTFPKNPNGL